MPPLLLVAAYQTRRGFNGMAQPDHTAFERLAAGQSKRLTRAWAFIGGTVIIDNALNAGQAIDGWEDQCAELIDQSLFQERAVDRAATFEQQRLRTENTRQLRQGSSEVVASRACEEIGHAIFTKLGEIGVRYLFAEDSDDVITARMVLAVMHPSRRIDGDRERSGFPVTYMRFPRQFRHIFDCFLLTFGDLRHSFAADDPSIGFE